MTKMRLSAEAKRELVHLLERHGHPAIDGRSHSTGHLDSCGCRSGKDDEIMILMDYISKNIKPELTDTGHRPRLRKDRKIYREMHAISRKLGDRLRKGRMKKGGKPSLTRSQLAHRESWGNGWENAFNEAADMVLHNKVTSLRSLARQFMDRAKVRGYVPGWDRGEIR